MHCPLIHLVPSSANKATTSPISLTVPILCSAEVRFITDSNTSLLNWVLISMPIVVPQVIAFAVIPNDLPKVTAHSLVSASKAAFEAA